MIILEWETTLAQVENMLIRTAQKAPSENFTSGTLHACCNKTLAAVRLVLYYIFTGVLKMQLKHYLTVFWYNQCSYYQNNINKREVKFCLPLKYSHIFWTCKHISVPQLMKYNHLIIPEGNNLCKTCAVWTQQQLTGSAQPPAGHCGSQSSFQCLAAMFSWLVGGTQLVWLQGVKTLLRFGFSPAGRESPRSAVCGGERQKEAAVVLLLSVSEGHCAADHQRSNTGNFS